jgi:isoquinoline 1-oxidoreductase
MTKRTQIFEPDRHELREGPVYVFTPSRREFLEFAGGGLLLMVVQPTLSGQRQSSVPPLQTRLHIAEDGVITVVTGKVEEGQGPRTEMAMAAAEELRVPLTQIRVTMADTDVSPDDWITAGSRSTPVTVPQVRRAAATVRTMLEQASAKADRHLTYGDLAKSPELAKAYTETPADGVPLTTPAGWAVLGRPQGRLNGTDVVTGAHHYPSDIRRPGMLYGCVLRAPALGASLVEVDTKAASSISGTTVVHDGEFAGCAAPTAFQARKAVAAMAASAKWNEKAGQPSSVNLFEYLKKTAQSPERAPQARGDVEKVLSASSRRFQATFQTAFIQHAPMEPRAAVAEWQDGKLTVWTGTSHPFGVREQLSEAFRIPQQRVRVIVPDMGGGFGGKHTGEVAIEAARLAREAGKPVSLRWTRAEEFMWAYCRPAALIEVQAALDDRGAVAAWDFANYNSGAAALETPYKVGASRHRYLPSDSPLRQGSYRALASTANNFAREAFMDELAHSSGQDPLEFRLAHLENARVREVLLAATQKFRWQERAKQKFPNRGVGVACGMEKNSVVAACVEVEVDATNGTPRLLEICQAFECGAVLNPLNLRSQVEGCILMGLGAALREEILFEDGRLKNGRFANYRVTRFHDVPPKMEILLLDKKEADPVGAGETPIIAVAPAMANAIFAATGRRVRSLPLRPAAATA